MKTRTLQTTLLAALTWTVFTLSATGQALAPVQDSPDGPWYMPGEILIKFKADATDAELQDAIRLAAVGSVKHIQTRAMKAHGDHGITRADTTQSVAQAIKALEKHPAVEYAQPNWVYKHQETSSDPYFLNGSLWGMYDSGYGSRAAAAWAAGSFGSSGVYIGIIDEGIQFDHPDLAANMWVNPGEFEKAAGVDDDGNGYVDDIYGWNAIGDNGNIYDPASDDHGTHVAGTIGAEANNNLGVVGVSWNVKMISGKFLGPNGGTTADAVQAIDYMTDLKATKGLNIVALNNSWGGGAYDQTLLASIVRAAKAQILFVAAAGNGNWRGKAINTDVTSVYPPCYDTTTGADYDSVIAVTAISSSGAKPSWANYGAQTVDLGAPGVGILSTFPGGSYATADGTSMATPHVTGAIALCAATYPGAKASAIKDALLASTMETSSLFQTTTHGRLDIKQFLTTAPVGWVPQDPLPSGKPAAPSDLSATAISFSQIKLTWTDNSNNETEFKITRTDDTGDPSTKIVVPANATAYIDRNLAGSTTYTYSIQACNTTDGCSEGDTAVGITLGAPLPASAAFVNLDTATKGNWLGNYGGKGYDIAIFSKTPDCGTVTFAGYIPHTWGNPTNDLRALQNSDGLSRFAACYYSSSSFTIDLNCTDNKPRRVSLYCVDFDTDNKRRQTIRIFDRNLGTEIVGTSEKPTAQSLVSFNGGQYVTWDITGPVIIRVTDDSPLTTDNAVVSGIFFDTPFAVTPTAPVAPSDLTNNFVSKSQINLLWADKSTDETGFEIERSTSNVDTSFSWIATVRPDVESFLNTGLAGNTTYYYRVRATRAPGVYSVYTYSPPIKTPRR